MINLGRNRLALTAFGVTLVVLLCIPGFAQTSTDPAKDAPAVAAAPACAGLPPGKHAQLERMTDLFGLTCEQELKIEPLLHNEESVSKPLLRFAAFSPEEKSAMMLKVKLAARRQIKTMLTADQQKKMDEEIESVARGGSKGGGGGKKGKSSDSKTSMFDDEEALSNAIEAYSALTADEKKSMILQVKTAARHSDDAQLSSEQQAKLDADIKQLSGKM